MSLDKPLNLDFDQATAKTPAPDAPQRLTNAEQQKLNEEIEQLRKELQAKNKILDAKNQEISEIKIKNRQLLGENNDIQARQKILEKELGKAEVQIQLIQELLLNEDDASDQEERGTNE